MTDLAQASRERTNRDTQTIAVASSPATHSADVGREGTNMWMRRHGMEATRMKISDVERANGLRVRLQNARLALRQVESVSLDKINISIGSHNFGATQDIRALMIKRSIEAVRDIVFELQDIGVEVN